LFIRARKSFGEKREGMMVKNPSLSLVQPGQEPASSPPACLSDAGRKLWTSVITEYAIVDSGGFAMLEPAPRALGRARDFSAQHAPGGAGIMTKSARQQHP